MERFWLCVFLYGLCSADDYEEMYINRNITVNFMQSTFTTLKDIHIEARETTETKYPWIARVIHSRTEDLPSMCTAVCVDKRIFLTSYRCLFNLKVEYTSVVSMGHRFSTRALVYPTEKSAESFDDVAFIVVEPSNFRKGWKIINVNPIERGGSTDFKWFTKLKLYQGPLEHVVVGYGYRNKSGSWDDAKNLAEMYVVVGVNLCEQSYSIANDKHSKAFQVPCYHPCKINEPCTKYHGVGGSPLINTKTNTLFGVTTWGFPDKGRDAYYPVGFSVVNSKSYKEDFICATKIRDHNGKATGGLYQKLCDEAKRRSAFRYFYRY